MQGVQQASKKDKDDEGAQAEAWGNLFGNAAVIVGMHYGHAGAEAFRDRDNTKILNRCGAGCLQAEVFRADGCAEGGCPLPVA